MIIAPAAIPNKKQVEGIRSQSIALRSSVFVSESLWQQSSHITNHRKTLYVLPKFLPDIQSPQKAIAVKHASMPFVY